MEKPRLCELKRISFPIHYTADQGSIATGPQIRLSSTIRLPRFLGTHPGFKPRDHPVAPLGAPVVARQQHGVVGEECRARVEPQVPAEAVLVVWREREVGAFTRSRQTMPDKDLLIKCCCSSSASFAPPTMPFNNSGTIWAILSVTCI